MADELFEVLDEDGNKTGQKKLRTLVHKDGDWHRGIHAWVINDNKEFLLQKRSKTKDSEPGKWSMSLKGHLIGDDDSLSTVIRELKEELNLDAVTEKIQYLFTTKKKVTLNNGKFVNHEFDDVYLIRLNFDLDKIKLQKEEVEKVKMISADELKELLTEGAPDFVSEPEEDSLFLEYLEREEII